MNKCCVPVQIGKLPYADGDQRRLAQKLLVFRNI